MLHFTIVGPLDAKRRAYQEARKIAPGCQLSRVLQQPEWRYDEFSYATPAQIVPSYSVRKTMSDCRSQSLNTIVARILRDYALPWFSIERYAKRQSPSLAGAIHQQAYLRLCFDAPEIGGSARAYLYRIARETIAEWREYSKARRSGRRLIGSAVWPVISGKLCGPSTWTVSPIQRQPRS